jgi:putative SOS response-associated peptidase YedK
MQFSATRASRAYEHSLGGQPRSNLKVRGQYNCFRSGMIRCEKRVRDGWRSDVRKLGLGAFSYRAYRSNPCPMVMAGLWAKWKDPKSGNEIQSCTVLTCGPNRVMVELHDRMPVILLERDWAKWLGEEPATEQELVALLKPCSDDVLKIWPVGKAVGNVKNTGPELALPLSA